MARNEDSLRGPIVSQHKRYAAWMVADGLGGSLAGDVASRRAVDAASTALLSMPASASLETVSRTVLDAAQTAVRELRAEADAHDAASTLSVLITDGASISWAHVGDTRIYRLRDGRCEQLTQDQSVAYAMLSAANRSGDTREHPERSNLYSVLGSASLSPEIGEEEPLRAYDAFLICSDGVWEPVAEAEMAESLDESPSAKSWLDRVRQKVHVAQQQHRDNFSAIAIRAGALPGEFSLAEFVGPQDRLRLAFLGTALVSFGLGVWIGRMSGNDSTTPAPVEPPAAVDNSFTPATNPVTEARLPEAIETTAEPPPTETAFETLPDEPATTDTAQIEAVPVGATPFEAAPVEPSAARMPPPSVQVAPAENLRSSRDPAEQPNVPIEEPSVITTDDVRTELQDATHRPPQAVEESREH
jgi:PPM family protein phosphatase